MSKATSADDKDDVKVTDPYHKMAITSNARLLILTGG
jgi:hypothetical protein